MSDENPKFLQHVGEGIEHPHYAGDAGFDLVCAEHARLFPGDFADVDCGVAVALPEGTWGLITGRSSTFRRHRLHVVQGVIDNGFRGPLKVGLYNVGPQPVEVEPGDQLAQLIVMPLVEAILWRVDELRPGNRGEAGFGSTTS